MKTRDYPFVVEPLSPEDGGGYLAAVPDLPGCMSNGDTPANVQDAIAAWIEEANNRGRAIPEPRRRLAAA